MSAEPLSIRWNDPTNKNMRIHEAQKVSYVPRQFKIDCNANWFERFPRALAFGFSNIAKIPNFKKTPTSYQRPHLAYESLRASHIMLPTPEWEAFWRIAQLNKKNMGRGPFGLLWFAPRDLFVPGSGRELLVLVPRAVHLPVSIVLRLLCRVVPLSQLSYKKVEVAILI